MKPGIAQRARPFWKQESVRCHRKVFDPGESCDEGHELFDIVAQERFSAGEPDFMDTQTNGDTNDALDFLEGKNL
jgi:hypothetical protein